VCPAYAYKTKLLECSAPELEWDGIALTHHRTLACAQDDVIGPYAGDATLVLHTLEVAESGAYELVVLGDPADALIVSIIGCGGCDAAALTSSAGSLPRIGWLDAGRYSLRLWGPAEGLTSIGFRLSRVEGWPKPPAPSSQGE